MIKGERPLPKEATESPEPPKESIPPEEVWEVERTSPELSGVEFHFLYTGHRLEDIGQILEKIKDADLILLEAVGMSPQEKKEGEKFYNQILQAKNFATEEGKKKLREHLDPENFNEELLFHLAGSEKLVRLIDIPSTHPAYETLQRVEHLHLKVPNLIAEGKIEEALEAYIQEVENLAEADIQREDYALAQIEMFPQNLKGFPQIKEVAVVQGTAHSFVHHRFKAASPEIPVRISYPERPVYLYSGLSTLTRQKRLLPQKEIPKIEYMRGFLKDHIFDPSAQLLLKGSPDGKKKEFSTNLSQKLSPEEIEEIFEEFPKIYARTLREEMTRQETGGLDTIKTREEVDLRFVGFPTVLELTSEWAEKKGIKVPKGFKT